MTGPLPLRIASYNIRKAVGTDRRRDPDRVLRVISDLGADVVALQEADLRLPPRRPVFLRQEIFERTGLVPVSFEHGRESLGWHGNALLVSPGFEVIERHHHDLPGLEPRGLVSALLGMIPPGEEMPTLIAGDFNERSLEVGLGRLSRRFQILSGGPTYHSRRPVFALDRMAVTQEFQPLHLGVHRSAEADRASDHLPLVGEFLLGERAAG